MLLGWRDVPTDNAWLGESVSRARARCTSRSFVGRGPRRRRPRTSSSARLFVLRKVSLQPRLVTSTTPRTKRLLPRVACRRRTVVYKGMFLADQVERLSTTTCTTRASRAPSPSCTSASRPTPSRPGSWRTPTAWWPTTARSTPLRGNVNWMAARQAQRRFRALRRRHLQAVADLLRGPVRHRVLRQRARIPGRRAAIPLAHAVMMLIPEAWAGNPLMDEQARAPSTSTTPPSWSRGTARPPSPSPTAARSARRWTATACARPAGLVTKDDRVIMASEMGVLPVPESDIVRKWRLQPGKMLLDRPRPRAASSPTRSSRRSLPRPTPTRSGWSVRQLILEDLPPVRAARLAHRRAAAR